MKNTPSRHKAENVYKFEGFAERISKIDVNVFHKVKHPYEENDDESDVTHFNKVCEKWNMSSNKSEGYRNFMKSLPKYVRTLPLLLAQKNKIIDTMIEHIEKQEPEVIQPALELVVALARDLQQEFYPHFVQFLKVFTKLLDTQEVEQIDWTFTCLAYLFKCLWRFIVKTIDTILPELLCLLSDTKPYYVNNFAAESFAFVARKINDKHTFLKHALKRLYKHREGISGFGKLLFEIMKGVSNQFHSGTEKWLSVILQCVGDDSLPRNLLFNTLLHTVEHIAKYIKPNTNVEPVWSPIFKIIQEYVNKWKNNGSNKETNKCLLRIMKLIRHMLTIKDTSLRQPEVLLNVVNQLLSNTKDIPIELYAEITYIITLMLASQTISSKVQDCSRIIEQVMEGTEDITIALEFTDNLVERPNYQETVIYSLSKFCLKVFIRDGFLCQSLRDYLLKLVIVSVANNEEKLKLFPEKLFSEYNECEYLTSNFLNAIPDHDVEKTMTDSADVISSIFIAREIEHLKPRYTEKLGIFIRILCDYLNELRTKQTQIHDDLIFMLLISCRNFQKNSSLSVINPSIVVEIVTNILSHQSNLICLGILQIFISETVPNDTQQLRKILIKNLSSPYHQVRLISCDILSLLEHRCDLFKQMYKIEKIIVSIQNYREKLQLLQKLECNQTMMDNTEIDDYVRDGIIHFLLGNFYINFQLLWEPLQKIVVTHAFHNSNFWPIYKDHLLQASNMVTDSTERNSSKCDYVTKLFGRLFEMPDRIDVVNYRVLLLQNIGDFATSTFINVSDIYGLFLNFINVEYQNESSEISLVDIRKVDDSTNCKIADSANDTVDDDSFDIDEISNNTNGSTNQKNTTRVLLEHLKAMSKLPCCKDAVVKQNVINVYQELLTHKNSEIQKFALDCIFNNGSKNLTPYKENLYGLVGDKTFRNQLTTFSLDVDNGVIHKPDRVHVMPFVQRIILGKLRSSFHDKKSGQHKRELIFRFLAGCDEEEMITFIRTVFEKIDPQIRDNPLEMVGEIWNNTNLEKVYSPRQVSLWINMTMVLFKQCGGLLKHSGISYLLKILISVGATVVSLSNMKNEIHPGYFGILSKIRISLFNEIIGFFEKFTNYPWSKEEISSIFKVYVWPWADKIHAESLQNPAPVMRLFIAWSKHERYYPLLGMNDEENFCPLHYLITYLHNSKGNMKVKGIILDVIETLVYSEKGNKKGENLEPIETNSNIVSDQITCENYGTAIVSLYVSDILKQLRNNLTNEKHVASPRRDLRIIRKITEFQLDKAQSSDLIQLLLPILKQKATSNDESSLQALLLTITNLSACVADCSPYISHLAPLFFTITDVPCRLLLCDLISKMSTKTSDYFTRLIPTIIKNLNAMDKQRLDKPDFVVRLQAIKEATEKIGSRQVSLYMGVILIYNFFYMMKEVNDMGLRNKTSFCLKMLCSGLCQTYTFEIYSQKVLLESVLLPLIRDTINDKNESFRHEVVLLLGHMAVECHKQHPVFKDLNPLTNDDDVEDDFFENILHLQIHRKAKAVQKFYNVMKKQTVYPQSRTLVHFILPMISPFLLNSDYANKNNLIDCSIKALKVICRLLPWKHYENILKHYLGKLRQSLEFQKQSIRIVTDILDAFRYDVSKAATDAPILYNEECENDDDKENVENNGVKKPNNVTANTTSILKRTKVLCRSDAIKVCHSITNNILPKLNRTFLHYTELDKYHKSNKKQMNREKEDLDLLKIPLAIAIVKLLRHLPSAALDENISSIFMKLCTYLKSKLLSVRIVARNTIISIINFLGPNYLKQLICEMISVLTKGYQLHVLVFTCHSIVEKTAHLLQQGQMDESFRFIIQICTADLFGEMSEEKEVAKISSKHPEARGNKSYNMLRILSQYITEKHLIDVILPFKKVLIGTLSHDIITKVGNCFKYIVIGFVENTYLPVESLLSLAYGLATNTIPALSEEKINEKEKEKLLDKPDIFLISTVDTEEQSKARARINYHLFMEMGLQLLHFMLKREILKKSVYHCHLNPFVVVVRDGLKSQHVKLTTLSLQCLSWLLKRDLPSIRDYIEEISDLLFVAFHKYTYVEVELAVAAFKAVSVLVRDVKYHKVNEDQLRSLVLYVESNLEESVHENAAFTLLKAILTRKYVCPELHEVMKKVSALSIFSKKELIRTDARQVFYQYLLDYPIGKSLNSHIEFYISQFDYTVQCGRESSLQMITRLVQNFPQDLLAEYSHKLFLPLAVQMVNDESVECKKMASECIAIIVSRLECRNEANELLLLSLTWMTDSKVVHSRLAAQLIGIFVKNMHKDLFCNHIHEILEMISSQLIQNEEGRYVKAINSTDEIRSQRDHHLFMILQLFVKLMTSYSDMMDEKRDSHHIELIADYSQILLKHPHDWIRLSAAQVIGHIFQTLKISEISSLLLITKSKKTGFLRHNVKNKIKSLAIDFCEQLVPGCDVKIQLLTQSMKNLLFLAEVIKDMNNDSKVEDDLSLRWLIMKLKNQISLEISATPHSYTVRNMVFNWFAAIAVKLPPAIIASVSNDVLSPVLRETSILDPQGETTRNIADEVISYYRKAVSQHEFNEMVFSIERKLEQRRAERREALAKEAIIAPERAAKRKLNKQMKKKDQKKRRLEKLRKKKPRNLSKNDDED